MGKFAPQIILQGQDRIFIDKEKIHYVLEANNK